MVSDYKFHSFHKCLKKGKWRPERDLSLPGISIFHCCQVGVASPQRWKGSLRGPGYLLLSLILWMPSLARENISTRFLQIRDSGQISSRSGLKDSLLLKSPRSSYERS